MTDDAPSIVDLAPFEVLARGSDTDGEYARFELTLHPRTDSSIADSDLSHLPWVIDYPIEHVHPIQDEHWTVLDGTFSVAFDGEEHTLVGGDEIVLPANVSHWVWNPTTTPARVVLEFRPAMTSDTLTETLYVLGQRGETGEDGNLRLLQYAVTQATHPDQLYLTGIPLPIQKFLVRALAPLGRTLGYEPIHRIGDVD